MKRLSKFLHLSLAEQALLLEVMFILWLIRIGMWLLPFSVLRLSVAKMTEILRALKQISALSLEKVVWAVAVCSRYVPRAGCLTQALAAQMLLAQQGHASRIRIGVAKFEPGHLQAHAWLESHGRVVIGGSELDKYTPLPLLNECEKGR